MSLQELFERKASASIVDLLPIVKIEENCFVDKNSRYIDLLSIETKDLDSASENEVNYDIYSWTKFYKTFRDDVKIISLNFPTNTKEQTRYVQRIINKTKNDVYNYFLESKLSELEYIENNRTNREFYLMIFSKNLEQHKDNLNILTKSIGGKGLVETMTLEKKIQILFKINNKCTSIFD